MFKDIIRGTQRKKIELWAEGTRTLSSLDISSNQNIGFIFKVIENNSTVPVILVNEKDSIISYRNIDTKNQKNPTYHSRQLQKMKAKKNSELKIFDLNFDHFLSQREDFLL